MPFLEETYDIAVVGADRRLRQHWHVPGLDLKQYYLQLVWIVSH